MRAERAALTGSLALGVQWTAAGSLAAVSY
jgi:hypothetical protein